MTGAYGMVEWISTYASVEEYQRGQEAVGADAEFSTLVDKELSKVYLPGAVQSVFRKLA